MKKKKKKTKKKKKETEEEEEEEEGCISRLAESLARPVSAGAHS